MFDFEKFTENLSEDVVESSKLEMTSNDEFEKTPYGVYEVEVDEMSMKRSKKTDKKMLYIRFSILTGEKERFKLFYYKPYETEWSFMRHDASKMLASLLNDRSEERVNQINAILKEMTNDEEFIDEVFSYILGRYEYQLNYYEEKGFDQFIIEDVFELE